MRFFAKTTLAVVIALSISMPLFLVGKKIGIAEGRSMGAKEALKTNPVSEELELVCAGLWIGEQNRKYQAMEKGSK